jgi:hypothetical protein
MARQANASRPLPRAVIGLSLRDLDGEPLCVAEVVVLRHPVLSDQDPRFDIAEREVGNRIAARLVQQDDVFAVGDPPVSKTHPHAATQRLSEQQSRRQRLLDEEVPHRPGGQRALLPCQTHRRILS